MASSGPMRGAKWLQAAVGAKQDGAIGPNTLSKVEENDSIEITNAMCDHRLTFLQNLDTWSTFGMGWKSRVDGVRTTAIAMAEGNG